MVELHVIRDDSHFTPSTYLAVPQLYIFGLAELEAFTNSMDLRGWLRILFREGLFRVHTERSCLQSLKGTIHLATQFSICTQTFWILLSTYVMRLSGQP